MNPVDLTPLYLVAGPLELSFECIRLHVEKRFATFDMVAHGPDWFFDRRVRIRTMTRQYFDVGGTMASAGGAVEVETVV
ncbi:MAG TPA: hypothetical protein PKH39_14720 [Woeseiaceae bacterium]|nr:hypothetical protein [Woeseiaceae bacterium]